MIHEIVQDGERWVGSDGRITVSILDAGGSMFKRRAVKGVGGGDPTEVCWLVSELGGVKVYQQGDQIVITRQDLRP